MVTRKKALGVSGTLITPLLGTYLQSRESTTNTNNYSFVFSIVGDTTEPHHVLVVALGKDEAGTIHEPTVTVAGQSTTRRLSRTGSGGETIGLYITDAEITSTSGTVSLVFSSNQLRAAAGIYQLVNLQSAVPIDTATGIASSLSSNLTSVLGGWAVGGVFNGDTSSTTMSVSGDVTQDISNAVENQRYAWGSGPTVAPTTNIITTESGGTSEVHVHATFK